MASIKSFVSLLVICLTFREAFGLNHVAVPTIVVVLPEEVQQCNISEDLSNFDVHQLHIIPWEPYYRATTRLVSMLFRDRHTCCNVIRVVGELDYQTANIIHTLADRSNVSITLVASSTPPDSLPVANLDLPNVLDMNPLLHYIDAVIRFFDQLSWTRIGLITDNTNYHLFAAEILQKKLLENPERTIAPYVRLIGNGAENWKAILQRFDEYGTKIIAVLADKETECSILDTALAMGMKWPRYAFVLLELEHECKQRGCQLDTGVIVMSKSIQEPYKNNNIISCFKMGSSCCAAQFNMIQNAILVAMSDLPVYYSLGEPIVKLRKLLINVSFLQFQEDNGSVIALYNSDQFELQLFREKFSGESFPSGSYTTLNAGGTVLHISLVSISFILSLVFITVSLILYILFRNEPEVKATSVTVSMCMFLGCYLLVIFVPLLLLESQPFDHTKASATLICTLVLWLSTVGPPFSLIFATLIVKMLRVYLIFSKPFAYKKKFFSSPALLLYIFLIVSPNILSLILISAVDEFTKVRKVSTMKSHQFVRDRCGNKYTIIWSSLLIVYHVTVILALIIIALKSSKVRSERFNDSKGTNAFTYLSVLIAILNPLYWNFFRILPLSLENVKSSYTSLYIAHMAEAWLCQILLFVPKILPPIMRRLSRRNVEDKEL
jgi:hypothetical protein